MSDPVKYNPDYSFENWQTNNPKLPLPGPRVDDEYANIAISISDIVDAIMDVRRSDGALKNGIVTADSLSPTLKIGFTFRGTWAAGVEYLAGDGVVFNSAFYSAQINHLSSASNDPSDPGNPWTFLYSVDDLVTAGAVSIQKANYNGDGVTTVFAVPIAPASVNNVIVEVGSVVYRTTQYSVAGTNVTISPAPALGAPIELRVIATIGVQDLETAVYTARDDAIAAAAASASSAADAQSSEDDAEAAAAAAAATAASMLPNPPTDGYTYGRDTSTWVRLPTAIPGAEWAFSNSTASGPASTTLRVNNATLSAATLMYIHKTAAFPNVDQSSLLGMILVPGLDLFFGSENDEKNWVVYTVTGLPTDSGTYFTVPIVYKAAGNALVNNEYGRLAPLGGAGSKVVTDDVAPSGALDGQQWWKSTNGKMYVLYDDGTGSPQWVEASGAAGSSGGVNLAGYSVHVDASAVQNIASATATKMTGLNTVVHDPSGFWSLGSQRFQPTRAGLYLITVRSGWTPDAANKLMVQNLYKNGSPGAVVASITSGGATLGHVITGSRLVLMNGSSDYLELWITQGNAGATDIGSISFSATYLGEAGQPQPSTRTALSQNLIVNPAMQVSQENGAAASGGQGYYPADQWQQSYATSATFTLGQVASRTPRNSQNRIRLVITAADVAIAAGDLYRIVQPIEGVRLANLGWNGPAGTQLVLRFGFKGPAGTYSVAYRNSNGTATRSWVSNFTITAGQANTDVEITKIIPADNTGGTWGTSITVGAELSIALMSGTTYITTPDAWQTGNFVAGTGISNGLGATGTFELFDVGLYPDPDNSGIAPAWTTPQFDAVLRECQRYWAKGNFTLATSALTGGLMNGSFKVEMRTIPVMTCTPGSGSGGTLAAQGTDAFYQNAANSVLWGSTWTASARM